MGFQILAMPGGLFNADPHPGNLLVDVRSRTAVLLDFGLTKEVI